MTSAPLLEIIDRRLAFLNKTFQEYYCNRPLSKLQDLHIPLTLRDQPIDQVYTRFFRNAVDARDAYRAALPELRKLAPEYMWSGPAIQNKIDYIRDGLKSIEQVESAFQGVQVSDKQIGLKEMTTITADTEKAVRIISEQLNAQASILCTAFEQMYGAQSGSENHNDDRRRIGTANPPAMLFRFVEGLKHDSKRVDNITKWLRYDWDGATATSEMLELEKMYQNEYGVVFSAWVDGNDVRNFVLPWPIFAFHYSRSDVLKFFTGEVLLESRRETWFRGLAKQWNEYDPAKLVDSKLKWDFPADATKQSRGPTQQQVEQVLQPALKFRQLTLAICETWGREEVFRRHQAQLLLRLGEGIHLIEATAPVVLADLGNLKKALSSLLEILSSEDHSNQIAPALKSLHALGSEGPSRWTDTALAGYLGARADLCNLGPLLKDKYYRPSYKLIDGISHGVIAFAHAFEKRDKPPKVLTGLTNLDVDNGRDLEVSIHADDVNVDGFQAHLSTYSSDVNDLGGSWLAIPSDIDSYDVQHGRESVTSKDVNLGGDRAKGEFTHVVPVEFWLPYKARPKVACWLTGLGTDHGYHTRMEVKTANVTESGFDLVLRTWDDTQLHRVDAEWIAFNADRRNVQIFRHQAGRNKLQTGFGARTDGLSVKFDGRGFQEPPVVFHALNYLDSDSGMNTRVRSSVTAVDEERAVIQAETWSDSRLFQAGYTVVAVGSPRI